MNFDIEIYYNTDEEDYLIDSRNIAECVGMSHVDLCKAIAPILSMQEKIRRGRSLDVLRKWYKDSAGKRRRYYLLDSYGFSLIEGVITGENADEFKEKCRKKFRDKESKPWRSCESYRNDIFSGNNHTY